SDALFSRRSVGPPVTAKAESAPRPRRRLVPVRNAGDSLRDRRGSGSEPPPSGVPGRPPRQPQGAVGGGGREDGDGPPVAGLPPVLWMGPVRQPAGVPGAGLG